MITFLLTAAMGFAALSPATVQAADNSIATYATERKYTGNHQTG